MPILRYGYTNCFLSDGSLATALSYASAMDSAIASILTEQKARFAKCSRIRMHLPSEQGGYGLKSVVDLLEESVVYAYSYIACTEELGDAYSSLLAASSRRRTIIADMGRITAKYDTLDIGAIDTVQNRCPISVRQTRIGQIQHVGDFSNATQAARAIVPILNAHREKERMESWLNNVTQARIKLEPSLCQNDTFRWLAVGHLNARAVRDAVAIQENQLYTAAHAGQAGGNPTCRQCRNTTETIPHVVSGCPTFRTGLMTTRHDQVARQIHTKICNNYGLSVAHYTQKVPEVVENHKATIYWNHSFNTANIRCNTPDIVVLDKVKKTIKIVEIGISWFARLTETDAHKYYKYAVNGDFDTSVPTSGKSGPNLAKVLSIQHKMVTTVLPIIIGTCGEMTSSVRRNLNMLFDNPAPREIDDLIARLGRSAVLGTGLVLRAHLST